MSLNYGDVWSTAASLFPDVSWSLDVCSWRRPRKGTVKVTIEWTLFVADSQGGDFELTAHTPEALVAMMRDKAKTFDPRQVGPCEVPS